jgi:hypothetical protein
VAALKISSSKRECSSFGVTKKTLSATSYQFLIEFLCDNNRQLTLLEVFDSSLEGTALLVVVCNIGFKLEILLQVILYHTTQRDCKSIRPFRLDILT